MIVSSPKYAKLVQIKTKNGKERRKDCGNSKKEVKIDSYKNKRSRK